MDPQETLCLLADALKNDDLEVAAEHLDDLRCWLYERGGFQPDWNTPEGGVVMNMLFRLSTSPHHLTV